MKKLAVVLALTCIVMGRISNAATAQDSPLASPLDCVGDCMVGAAIAEWHTLYIPFLENSIEYSASRGKRL